jgi:hypothetical protein
MNKIKYIWTIVKDRWIKPYDDIILRFNTKAKKNDPYVWRVIVNGHEDFATSFEIHGYVYDVLSEENGVTKYNVGCKGRVRWDGSKAIIITAPKAPEEMI